MSALLWLGSCFQVRGISSEPGLAKYVQSVRELVRATGNTGWPQSRYVRRLEQVVQESCVSYMSSGDSFKQMQVSHVLSQPKMGSSIPASALLQRTTSKASSQCTCRVYSAASSRLAPGRKMRAESRACHDRASVGLPGNGPAKCWATTSRKPSQRLVPFPLGHLCVWIYIYIYTYVCVCVSCFSQ